MSSTLLRSTRSRVAAACAAAAIAAPLVLASPASAGLPGPTPVTGVATCDTATGMNEIIWTITNTTGEIVTIDGATLDGAITGDESSWLTNPIPVDGTSKARTLAPVGTTGLVNIFVDTSWVDGEFPMDATTTTGVTLGTCVIATTTTTSTTAPTTTSTTAPATTSTTAPAPVAVAVVVASPTFTG